jgi:transcriptional regulator with XRE-family HTH domain
MLLKRSRMPRNQVAAISGLSNSYIRLLENGETARVVREKLISFAVALNLDLNETDALLNIFDRAKLSTDDIPTFVSSSEQVQMSSAMLPLRDVFIIELMFLSVERLPGKRIIVNDRPTSCLRPEGHRTYSCRRMDNSHPLQSSLTEAIGRERKLNMLAKLAYYPIEEFVFKDSLEEYILECIDPKERDWRIKHLENEIWHLEKYDNLELFLTEANPIFMFTLKMPEESSKENPKLTFIGKHIDFFIGEGTGRLAGFATDNLAFIENFIIEVNNLREHVIPEYLDRTKLITYLKSLIKRAR